ncbi:hypothetical protein BAY61_22420 [Prauserella marina]|uniref:Uncharacterized protein n=1 Tax=Prauserella marina TaxID=530584 RepID=A0A222VTP2_9PSEU|nr:hypothetical protein [Prauserella marina]ASR37296.1 hypothetical protein BAY61_22420 [Prauserella marina]PWV72635.1 hypothetical protein DES30_110236 [Prauserella marina]SDD75508.1 hypothetical protein SAMN05421630_1122 [Prauserella marina]
MSDSSGVVLVNYGLDGGFLAVETAGDDVRSRTGRPLWTLEAFGVPHPARVILDHLMRSAGRRGLIG